MPLIITGCPRSGTMTAANVFGMWHERQLSVSNVAQTVADVAPIESECAWPAAPFVPLLLERGLRVVHLVRNPLHTIASMVARQMFGREDHVSDQFIRQHLKMPLYGTPLQNCTRLWVAWNQMLSDLHVPRIRIEDIANAPRLHKGPQSESLTWDDIPMARELAKEYGYATG